MHIVLLVYVEYQFSIKTKKRFSQKSSQAPEESDEKMSERCLVFREKHNKWKSDEEGVRIRKNENVMEKDDLSRVNIICIALLLLQVVVKNFFETQRIIICLEEKKSQQMKGIKIEKNRSDVCI